MLEREGNGGGCSGNKISCVFTYQYIEVHSVNTIIPVLMSTIVLGNVPKKKFQRSPLKTELGPRTSTFHPSEPNCLDSLNYSE